MTLKITRVRPGHYTTMINGEGCTITDEGSVWRAVVSTPIGSVTFSARTKGKVIAKLDVYARMPSDRQVSPTLQLFRRSLIEKHTQLTVEGIRGKCSFISYTRKDDGSEWIDIITSKLQARTVRPERIITVHRSKSASR